MQVDCHSTTPIKSTVYSKSELLTVIARQILVGNYTNYYLLLTLLPELAMNQSNSFDIQESLEQIKARCREQQTEQPCQHALTLMGTLYLFGVGYPQKYDKAISCFEKAMTFNNSYAINNCGFMYMYVQELSDFENPGEAEAIRLFQKAVELGNPLAMNNLAEFYQEQGGKDNVDKAIALNRQAIDLGHVKAMNDLASLYEQRGDSDSIAKAIALYQQAIELGDARAMNNLAMLYGEQGGLDKIAKAISLYQQAIESGYVPAMNNLAFFLEAQGGSDNISKAIALYQQAIESGYAPAMNNLALLFEAQGGSDNISNAIALCKQAIEKDASKVMNNLAVLYFEQGGTDNIAKAIVLFEEAIRSSYNSAVKNLTLLYKNPDITKNQEQIMQNLLPLIWKDLLAGVKFTEQTISALSHHCQKKVIEHLESEQEYTSLAFLKQLKTNPQHPLTLIINKGQNENNNFKSIMSHALSLHNTRVTFFNSKPENEGPCPLELLPIEMKMYVFSFVQPGLKHDKKHDYFLPCLNNSI